MVLPPCTGKWRAAEPGYYVPPMHFAKGGGGGVDLLLNSAMETGHLRAVIIKIVQRG
jgi:hypothetical protein